jgi:hypothetical protein
MDCCGTSKFSSCNAASCTNSTKKCQFIIDLINKNQKGNVLVQQKAPLEPQQKKKKKKRIPSVLSLRIIFKKVGQEKTQITGHPIFSITRQLEL